MTQNPWRAARDREALEMLGVAIRIARERSGLTQRALEALSGVDQTAISRMERGLRPGMAMVKFARVAQALGGHLLLSQQPAGPASPPTWWPGTDKRREQAESDGHLGAPSGLGEEDGLGQA